MGNTNITKYRLCYHTDDRPDMRDLHSNMYIVRQYAAQWERVGLELGLQDYDIANISKDNEHNPNRSVIFCRVMLEQWQREIPSATWGKLDDAIKNIKLLSTTRPVSTDTEGIYGYSYSVVSYQSH